MFEKEDVVKLVVAVSKQLVIQFMQFPKVRLPLFFINGNQHIKLVYLKLMAIMQFIEIENSW